MEKKGDVLLIEDKMYEADLMLRALKKSFPQLNYIILHDGEEALDFIFARNMYAYRQGEALPGLILLDLDLPKIRGLEVLQLIKSDEIAKRIPVVVLSVSEKMADVEKAYDLGANSYLVKEIDFAKFIDSLTEIGSYWLTMNKNPPMN
jgi:two-component system, response regulator